MKTRMDRHELLAHLRGPHGHAELEPGGRHHEPGSVGWERPLDQQDTDALVAVHRGDHDEVHWHHDRDEVAS